MALIPGETFEDMVASLTWSCAVSRWNRMHPRPVMIALSDVMYMLYHDIMYHRLELSFIFATLLISEVLVL